MESMKNHRLKRQLIFGAFVLVIGFFIVNGILVITREKKAGLSENIFIVATIGPAVPTEEAVSTLAPSPTSTTAPSPTVTLTPIPTEVPVYDKILAFEQEKETVPDFPVKAALLVNVTKNEIVYSLHATEALYPASITKLMTALTVFEQKETLDERVTVSKTAATAVIPSAKMCGFQEGDQISLYELLGCMLLYSGNDAAVAVAEYISGTEEKFVVQMNQIAKKMELNTSNFCNSHGLPDDNHITSAYDIYRIMEKLFHYEEFLDIIRMSSIEVDILRKEEVKKIIFSSTNQFLNGTYKFPEGLTLLGGKTGTTNKAGYCLAIYVAGEDGNCYIAEIFGADSYDSLYQTMIQLLSYISG